MDIFEQLNSEHFDIIDKYWSAFSYGLASVEGQAVLRKAQVAFFAHIFREENELYQILLAAAEKNAQIAVELSRINENASTFSKALSRVIIDSLSEIMAIYNAETRYYYRQIMYAILDRVTLEEKLLLEKYNNVFTLLSQTCH